MKIFTDLINDYKDSPNNLIHKEIMNLGYKPKVDNRVILEDIREFLIINNIRLEIKYDKDEKYLRGINSNDDEILFEYKDEINVDLENGGITRHFIKIK